MKKKVMIVVPYLTDGGAERVASLWANLLVDKYAMTLVTFYPMENEYPLSDKVKRINLFPSQSASKKGLPGIRILKKIIRLKKVLKLYPQDLIIPFLSHANVVCSLASCNRGTVIAQTIRCNPWIDPKRLLKRKIRDFFVKRRKSVIVQNAEQATYFEKYKQVKKYIVCNPLNPATINISKVSYGKINKIIGVGRLCKQKNQKMMIDAIAILRNEYNLDCQLDIYGIGELKDELNRYIVANKLEDCVTLKGRSNSIFEVEVNYDLFLMTSLFEGFPNALLEAMAVGLPVISTNCKTGPKDLIKNKENGFLLNSFDARALAELIIQINNADLLRKIGTQARADVQIYSQENCLAQLVDCIEDLTKKGIDK